MGQCDRMAGFAVPRVGSVDSYPNGGHGDVDGRDEGGRRARLILPSVLSSLLERWGFIGGWGRHRGSDNGYVQCIPESPGGLIVLGGYGSLS